MKQKKKKITIVCAVFFIVLGGAVTFFDVPDKALIMELGSGEEVDRRTGTGFSRGDGQDGDNDIRSGTDSRTENETGKDNMNGSLPTHDASDADPDASVIYVYVCGAVRDPKVVTLPEGSRAVDALELAGGFLQDADRDYVNLAAEVTDGERLFFPNREEAAALEKKAVDENAGIVNINTADENALTALPGIGSARAKAIVEYREKHGDFKDKESLMKVGGIKQSIYRDLEDKIRVE